ncbi:galectin-1-like [Polypterus senegalus]|uniref:galectin-1-like n=1 Tax=Polypterus senegalus TaxID=55291 RepID=UPI001962AC4F|nr:galectin-1-like [Polypterus senegalus]
MTSNVLVQNMAFKPGQVMKIKGTVAEETCSFAFNLGKDSQEYSLHFNPRFDEHGDSQTIVCNSMSSGAWGEEHRDSEFPFELGKETKVFISYQNDAFEIKLPNDHVVKFPNRFGDQTLNYLAVDGGFKLISFKVL